MTPFDFLNSINSTKANLMTSEESEKEYVPFVINRSLSYFPDTILYANEMNVAHHLDKRLQYDFFINTIRKRKRFSKWIKSTKSSDLEVVKAYYGYSDEKAETALTLLSEQQLKSLKEKSYKGGRKQTI